MARELKIFTQSDRIDALLAPFRTTLGGDYDAYRGHLLRVLTYTIHFLDGDESDREVIETALVYHDIGMWSDLELAYLEPSIAHVLADNRKEGWGYDPQLLTNLIAAHHKIFPFTGPNDRLVNAFRKGDWVDATGGLIRHGLTRAQLAAVYAAIPEAGFASTLMRLARDLHGGHQLLGVLKVLRRVYKL